MNDLNWLDVNIVHSEFSVEICWFWLILEQKENKQSKPREMEWVRDGHIIWVMSDWNADAINKSHLKSCVREKRWDHQIKPIYTIWITILKSIVTMSIYAAVDSKHANWIDANYIRKCFPTRLVESIGLSHQNRVTFEPKREFQRSRDT